MDFLREHSATEESEESDMRVDSSGKITYFSKKNPGIIHRENGPAIISPNHGTAQWYNYGHYPEGLCVITATGAGFHNRNKVETKFVHLTDNIKWKVLEEDVRCAMVIKVLTPKMQMFVVQEDPSLISYIQEPCKEAQEYIIKHRPDLVGEIQDLNPDLKEKYQHEKELGNVDL
jgi:hypothetical protein